MAVSRHLGSALAWYAVLIAISAVLLSAQSVLAMEPGIAVDLSPIAVLFFVVETDLVPGLGLTAVVACIADALSGAPPGLTAAGLVAAFLVMRLLVRRSPAMSPFVVVVLSATTLALAVAVRQLVQVTLGEGVEVQTASIGTALATLALAVPTYALLRGVGEPFRPRDDVGMRR